MKVFVVYIVLISVASLGRCFAQVAGQYLPDDLQDLDHLLQETDTEDAHIRSDKKTHIDLDPIVDEDSFQYSLPLEKSQELNKQNILKIQQGIAETKEEDSHLSKDLSKGAYIEYDKHDLLNSLYKKGQQNFAIVLGKNTFSYTTADNRFNKIFTDSSEADFPPMLTLSGSQFLTRKFGDLGYGLNIGVSLHRATGLFVDGQASSMKFLMWSVPVDAAFLYEVTFFEFLKLGVEGGPSLMLMMQNRTDVDKDDDRKNIYQYSPGYYLNGLVKFNITHLAPSWSHMMHRLYSVSQSYLTVLMRYHSYRHFKSDDIAISGTSIGVGLSYEYF